MKTKTILLSIHPCFVEKILSGEKLFEYRKNIPTDISHVVIYATVPIKNIVAFVEVDSVLKGSPQEIWEKTKNLVSQKISLCLILTKKMMHMPLDSRRYGNWQNLNQ